MAKEKSETIKVTVDKSHLITIGKRMYVESIELIRELVSNAYDADAAQVHINIGKKKITVQDNGTGMSRKGLGQYFNIGSPEKRIHSVSPRFGRKRIGEFGIGKFAALSAADRFEVETKRGKKVHTVIFDKKDWENQEEWELPIITRPTDPFQPNGTKVTLTKLNKIFSPADVEKRLMESVPLRARKFAVWLNGKRIALKYIPGRRVPIKQNTMYGTIEGEIIIAANPRLVSKPGVECRVRGVAVKKELFGFESYHGPGISRITGEVNVDFLSVASTRREFIIDNPAYQLFYKIMQARLEQVLKEIKKMTEARERLKTSRALKEILTQIREALKVNPELMPSGRVLSRKRKGVKANQDFREIDLRIRKKQKEREEKIEAEKKEILAKKPPKSIMRRLRLKGLGIACSVESLGEDGPEAYSQGNIVYINCDHPLYKKFFRKKDLQALYLARLITQEITLMKQKYDARKAYEQQGQLLKDTFC